jgi:tRNA(Arg) A34 adenosine deaminase TadA
MFERLSSLPHIRRLSTPRLPTLDCIMSPLFRLSTFLLFLLSACSRPADVEQGQPAPPWLTPEVSDSLKAAGVRSIPSGDVPAAAAVIYRGTIVTGWNDVMSNANAAGHADINALTAAMRRFGGAEAFKRIDRDSLYLVTTWEPCPMCKGAIADEHRLKPENVVVLMLKENDLLATEKKQIERFDARRVYVARPDIQQEFFCRHPVYARAYPEKCGQNR